MFHSVFNPLRSNFKDFLQIHENHIYYRASVEDLVEEVNTQNNKNANIADIHEQVKITIWHYKMNLKELKEEFNIITKVSHKG